MEKYVVIDLETTGNSPADKDKIIEVGIVVIENNLIVEEYSTLLNPNQPISPFIENLTGIKNKDVLNAPFFHEKASEIISYFHDSYLIAHNVPFDLGFLNTELSKNGFSELSTKYIDTVELSRILYPQAPGFKLNQLAEYLQINHKAPHRALSDAYVTAKLFLKLKNKLKSLPYETITQLIQLESELHSELHHLLHTLQLKKATEPLNEDQYNTYQGIAYKKINNAEKKFYENTLSFGDFLDNIYEVNGTLEQYMNNYEKRPGQREMSENIFDNFQTKQHALIEAETGTGKSLAYLLSAIFEAINTNKRIIISTYTTQLQSQLLEEEIPLIKKLVPFPFKTALLKGKSHYISLERFAYALSHKQEKNYDITLSKAMILIWLTETETGDVDEIQLPSSGYYFFRGISTEAEGLLDPQSPWLSRSYYHRARMNAQHADIIISNHALLCTDLLNEYNLLPTYEKAIIDEAHHLEHIASKYYGLRLDYVKIQYALNQLGTTTDGNFFHLLLSKYRVITNKFPTNKWDEMFNQTKYEVDHLFRSIFHYVVQNHENHNSFSDIGRIQYRYTDEENNQQWKAIKEMASRLIYQLRDLIHICSQLEHYFDKEIVLDKYDEGDLHEHIRILQTFIDNIEHLFFDNSINQVKWIEIEQYGAENSVYLYSEPANVAKILQENLFDKKQSIILTSATLTMRNSFSYIQNRVGLLSDEIFKTKIQSPFSYKEQVQLMIPNDFPQINDDDFIYSTCEVLMSLAEITEGRMLVLFTSYDMLRKSHEILKENMNLNEYMLIAQGISSNSRTRLKKNFQTFDKAILLGTSSFWEGVDIPGEDLSALMIVRLPFQPPNHPVFQAKAEKLKKEGKNAFFELSLPHAVLRFKQGFGRLIRSTNDRGIVFVCDGRIINSRYGKFFTESIPDVPISYDTTYKLIKKAEKWF